MNLTLAKNFIFDIMKKSLTTILFISCVIGPVLGQNDLEGTWIGKFNNPQGMSLTISWTFDDGTYLMDMNNDGAIEVEGKFEIVSDTLNVWDLKGNMACPENEKGSFTFEINGEALKIALVEDPCPGRSMITPNASWTRKSSD